MAEEAVSQMDDLTTWFEVRAFSDEVYGIGEPRHVQRVKSFLVVGDDRSLLFDTGMGIGDIRDVVNRLTDRPVVVVNSHSHWDHIGDNWQFDRIWIHEAEASLLPVGVRNERIRPALTPEGFTGMPPVGFDPDNFSIRGSTTERTLAGGDSIDLGGRTLRVIHSPGHSPGGITLLEERTGIALVGDAVYAGRLYAHLPSSDPVVYRATLTSLADLAPSLRTLYPSHGDYPLEPGFLVDVARGNEEVWQGRRPDNIEQGIEQYRFDRFSILLREGWRG